MPVLLAHPQTPARTHTWSGQGSAMRQPRIFRAEGRVCGALFFFFEEVVLLVSSTPPGPRQLKTDKRMVMQGVNKEEEEEDEVEIL